MPSYKDNKTGKWYFKVWKRDGNGINKQYLKRGFESKKEANIAEASFKLSKTNKQNIKFRELYIEYCTQMSRKLKPRSFECMQSRFVNHILPYFEKNYIKNITVNDIIDWQNKLTSQNYSHKYKEVIHVHLSSILKFAIKNQYVDRNVASIAGGFKDHEIKRDLAFWSLDEFNKFILSVDDPVYFAFFNFLYYTGLRLGEALALNWGDIKTDVVRVTKTISKRVKTEEYIITTPKTKNSNREVLLPSKLVTIMTNYLSTEKDKTDYSKKWFVFGGEKPMAETSITRKKDEYCKIAKVKRIKLHDFRHSHASLLINQGANPTIVAQRLGHSDISMTLNVYSHMFPNAQKEVIDLIDSL